MCFFENVTMTNEQLQERYSHVTTAGTNDPRLAPLTPGTLRWRDTRGRGCQRRHLVLLRRLIHHWFHSTAAAVSPSPLSQKADPTQDTPSGTIKSLSLGDEGGGNPTPLPSLTRQTSSKMLFFSSSVSNVTSLSI